MKSVTLKIEHQYLCGVAGNGYTVTPVSHENHVYIYKKYFFIHERKKNKKISIYNKVV